MDSKTLREKFLKFFEGKDHKIVSSSSLVPKGDTSVLLTTAGMQQFKSYFAGTRDVIEDFGNKNLASVQKCFRTSDIESVGDESHLTFFEMLGNFSIGGYGKEEAIEFAWELMTSKDWYGLPQDKFFATVFAGDEEIPADEESKEFWKGIAPNIEVKKLGREDNFWPNPVWIGTCGPSSELHYILDDGSSIEIWNLVFTQYFHNEDGSFKDLGQVNIDTGMGLERLAMVSQNKPTVFDTDLFKRLLQDLEKLPPKLNNTFKERIRIFLDHSRATFFLIADGVKPGKNEREWVLRKLIRKANDQLTLLQNDVAHTKSLPWWGKALKHYESVYGNFYKFKGDALLIIQDELAQYGEVFSMGNVQVVERKITSNELKSEEILTENLDKFLKTNDVPTFMHEHNFGSLPSVAAGTVAFEAKSTLGVPVEGPGGTLEITKQRLGPLFNENEFIGAVNVLSQAHQELSRTASAGMFKGGLADHSDVVIKYHTATHLLHQALRDVLGPQVFQKGSNITAERLRFDFSYDKKMTDEEIKKVEDIINERIKQDLKVDHMIITLDQAKKMGAIGLFDEKYGTEVSVYGIGPREDGSYYSLEFCGGPHVETTGVISKINRGTILQGKIKITKEEAVSSGVRRIKAEIMLP